MRRSLHQAKYVYRACLSCTRVMIDFDIDYESCAVTLVEDGLFEDLDMALKWMFKNIIRLPPPLFDLYN